MVKATFKKKSFLNIICLLCGLFLICLFVYIGYKDSEATTGGILAGVIFGTVFCILGIVFMLFNFKAYFYIEDGHIKGRYNYFSTINCDFSDVDFVLSQTNTLTILLKNGKRHVIMGVENSWELSSAIRRQTFKFESKATDDVRIELEATQATRKKELFWVFGGIALMFINIFIAVLLTDGKEMYEFGKVDWSLFAVMGVIETLTLIATFYFAGKCGRQMFRIDYLKYQLRGANIAAQPLPSGNPIRVYTDENYTVRIVVFGYPNSEEVYYCVQEFFESEFRLDTVHTSEIYESEESLTEEKDFYIFIDITEHFK